MKKLAVIFAAALLSVIVCDLAVSKTSGTAEGTETGQESQEEHVFEEVDRLIRAGQTDEALRLLDEEEDHTSAEYYYLKEMAYLEDGSEEADEALQKLYPEAATSTPSGSICRRWREPPQSMREIMSRQSTVSFRRSGWIWRTRRPGIIWGRFPVIRETMKI